MTRGLILAVGYFVLGRLAFLTAVSRVETFHMTVFPLAQLLHFGAS
jgi:hypothetical protein